MRTIAAIAICWILGGLCTAVPAAAAPCTETCVEVSPGCSRCQEVGFFTNQACANVGVCRCRFREIVCVAAQAAPAGPGATFLGAAAAPEPALCPAAEAALRAAARPAGE